LSQQSAVAFSGRGVSGRSVQVIRAQRSTGAFTVGSTETGRRVQSFRQRGRREQ